MNIIEMTDEQASSSFEQFFDRISTFCETNPVIAKEIFEAKEEFFAMTGKVRDNEDEFNTRMNAFLLWFIFDRKPHESLYSPVSKYQIHLEKTGWFNELEVLNNQLVHVHSLFKIVKIKNGITFVKDLISGIKYEIEDENTLMGMSKDIYFETRLFTFNDKRCFSNYFIQHPPIVNKGIRKQLKPVKREKKLIKPFLLKLHTFNNKYHKYRSIDIKSIYHFDQSIPEAK